MNRCIKCGNELKEHAKFCKICGGQASLGDKKARVMSAEKTWVRPAAIAAVVVLVAAGAFGFMQYRAKKMGARPMFAPHRDASARVTNAALVTAKNGDVLIPVTTVEDGNAHFFAFSAAGKTITFYVMKAADGTIKTAFDACVACNHAKLGYRQEQGMVVCNNCGMGFKAEEIGKETGGCNPIPIQRSLDGQMVVLKARDLEAGSQYF